MTSYEQDKCSISQMRCVAQGGHKRDVSIGGRVELHASQDLKHCMIVGHAAGELSLHLS